MATTGRAILLDTNVLLFAAVGQFDRALIGRKRLETYTQPDYDLLMEYIVPFRRYLTTPHLLAELSNLADQCVPKHRWLEFRSFMTDVLIAQLEEHWLPATELCQADEFYRLGLADAAICRIINDDITVLSVDAALCNVLWERGIDAQNFNHLRDQ